MNIHLPVDLGIPKSDLPWRAGFMPAIVAASAGSWICYQDGDEGCTFSEDKDEARRWPLAGAMLDLASAPRIELVDYLVVDFPMPPSTNALFVEAAGRQRGSGRQRVKTKPYKAWLETAGWTLKAALQRLRVTLPGAKDDALFADNFGLWLRLDLDHNSDITNRIKAPEDLLVAFRVTCGDQWNDRCTVERDRTIPPGTCRAVIYRIPA